ncbi:MAG: DUF6732 family protein [Pseudomonadota bacterium]
MPKPMILTRPTLPAAGANLALALALVLAPNLAAAHPGHLSEVAGHTHWIGALAGLAALGLFVWVAAAAGKDKRDKARTGSETDAEIDAETEDADEATPEDAKA